MLYFCQITTVLRLCLFIAGDSGKRVAWIEIVDP